MAQPLMEERYEYIGSYLCLIPRPYEHSNVHGVGVYVYWLYFMISPALLLIQELGNKVASS